MTVQAAMPSADDLRAVVLRAAAHLRTISDADASKRPAPGRWSAKEIIGHLIDSAANNHGRFVRAQLEADLVSAGYAQDDWVRIQAYQNASWLGLLDLWSAYNLHLAHVMESAAAGTNLPTLTRHRNISNSPKPTEGSPI